MMGGQHTEKNLLKQLGDWLKSSNWTTAGQEISCMFAKHVGRKQYTSYADERLQSASKNKLPLFCSPNEKQQFKSKLPH